SGIEERLAHGRAERFAFDGWLQDHPVTGFGAATALGRYLPAGANHASALGAAPHPPHVEANPKSRTLHRNCPIPKAIDSCTLPNPFVNRNNPARGLATMELLTQFIDLILHI